MSSIRRFLFFVVMFAMAFLTLLFSLFLVWRILMGAAIAPQFLATVGALAGIASATAILVGGFVAFRQLAEVANSRHLGVADRLFEELNSAENIAARRWIFHSLPDDPQIGIQSLTPEGQDAVKRVLNSLDHVAFLTQAGWISPALVMPWMHPMIAKSWAKLRLYVEYERARRNEPYYYERVDGLAEKCQAWRHEHQKEVQVKWVQDAL